jgi:hypothetical protein
MHQGKQLPQPRRTGGPGQMAHRRQPGTADFVIGIPHLDTARLRHVVHIPAQRLDVQNRIFERQLRRIGLEFGDAGVDPGDITLRRFKHAGGQARQFGIEIAAIMEQPRRRIRCDKSRAKGFRHAAEIAAMLDVDLKQSIARHQIALTEKGIVKRSGANMGNAETVFDNLDGAAGALCAYRSGPGWGRLGSQSTRQGDGGNRCHQKCAALDHFTRPATDWRPLASLCQPARPAPFPRP